MKTRQQAFRIARLAALCVASGAALSATAQQSFPNRTVRLVLPFAAGGGPDLVNRPVAEHMTKTLGQPVVLDNRPGGGGLVASQFVKAAPPDGHVFYQIAGSIVVQSVRDNPPVHILRDFTFIAPHTRNVIMVIVSPEHSKARTLKELIEESRANPGKLNYASYGMGTSGHMFTELLASEAKVKWVHVPFSSTTQAAAETVAGRTQLTVLGITTVAPFVSSGKLRMLAVSTAERWPLNPDVPGMRESGFPQIDFPVWAGYVGPAGMPREIVNRLNQAINLALKDPEVVEFYRKVQTVAVGGTPEDLKNSVEREYNAYLKLMKETGLKLE
jgi:tripartite-type tricarboxylate transporter receptor subunit TctC